MMLDNASRVSKRVIPRSVLYLLYLEQDQMIDRIVKTTTSVFIYLTTMGADMLNSTPFSHQTTLVSINLPLFVRWRHSFSLRADQPWLKD